VRQIQIVSLITLHIINHIFKLLNNVQKIVLQMKIVRMTLYAELRSRLEVSDSGLWYNMVR
jgi:hypothetical protein